MGDFLNAYIALVLSGLPEHRFSEVQVVLLDNHPAAWIDGMWSTVFSPARRVLRAEDLRKAKARSCYRHAVFGVRRGLMSLCVWPRKLETHLERRWFD